MVELIKNLPAGYIIWDGYNILGITGVDLPEKYLNYYAKQEKGNAFDFSIIWIKGEKDE